MTDRNPYPFTPGPRFYVLADRVPCLFWHENRAKAAELAADIEYGIGAPARVVWCATTVDLREAIEATP